MLKWCLYCQQFVGEVPEFDDFVLSHGICAECDEQYESSPSQEQLKHPLFLRGIFRGLFEAGKRNDFGRAERLVESALEAGCRPVDVLTGMIAPMLYRIGEDWKSGRLSIEGEHRFTAFCECVIKLIATKIATEGGSREDAQPPILLLNAPGNRHDLGLQIVKLWLESKLRKVLLVDGDNAPEVLMDQLISTRAKLLLISISLVGQRGGVEKIVGHVLSWPVHLRPKILVGGYAVKVGLLEPIMGTELTADIRALDLVL